MKYTVTYKGATYQVSSEASHDEIHDLIERMLARIAPNYGALVIERVE
jgi:hypothetical protein